MKTVTTLLLVMLLAAGASAQIILQPLIPPHALTVNVVLFGHSWVERMQGFQPWAFPNIPSQHVSIQGFGGYKCSMLLQEVYAAVPASTNAVFIMAATNDVLQGVPVSQHIACMESMIGDLIGENPNMLILVSNVPPVCSNVGDFRSAIAAYNQAYTSLPMLYPKNVKLVDMWTPMVDTSGWGLSNMFLDGVHPGTNGWDLVMGTIRDALYSNLPR
ncbi:MAG: GDSL-type esterase/lipase family protein [Candidatus Korobacteraceae bacterium]|jgi:lysophospholipase L1-like esterase